MHRPVQHILGELPNKPGVYQFVNAQGEVIYVGKAKDLKKRVSSYFNRKNYSNAKLRVMVLRVADIKYILVDTENDALLLENNLIKKLKPRYNVLLKDDKTYPWICIKNEPFPRVFPTRRIINDGSRYFGPYTSGVLMKTVLELIRSLYPLRNCNLLLTKENIKSGRFKSCLEFQLGNCKAPCIDNQTEEDYNKNIESIIEILSGNTHKISRIIKEEMKKSAADFRFEEAQVLKDKLEMINRYQARSTVVNPRLTDMDVFSIVSQTGIACVNYLKIIKGAIVQSHNLEIKKVLNESEEELLGYAISEIRQRLGSKSKNIAVSLTPDFVIEGCKYIVPERGDKTKLISLSIRNAKAYMMERSRNSKNIKRQERVDKKLLTLQKDLNLSTLPIHIECFDNSNLQGTNPVAACVVFRNAIPSKKEYRHFNIKTVEGPDDYASMEEVVYRRYKRMLDQQEPLPQLIIVDGGKGQLNAAYQSVKKLGIYNQVRIIGIAKRLEEIFFPGQSLPLYLNKSSESLKIIQSTRNEAHRFVLGFHRKKREKEVKSSVLEEIAVIGPKTIEALYAHFKSYDRIVHASLSELKKIIPTNKANIVFSHFHPE